jgi:hypothetical protein
MFSGNITTVDEGSSILHGSSGCRPGLSGAPVFADGKNRAGKRVIYGLIRGGPNVTNNARVGSFVSTTFAKMIPCCELLEFLKDNKIRL